MLVADRDLVLVATGNVISLHSRASGDSSSLSSNLAWMLVADGDESSVLVANGDLTSTLVANGDMTPSTSMLVANGDLRSLLVANGSSSSERPAMAVVGEGLVGAWALGERMAFGEGLNETSCGEPVSLGEWLDLGEGAIKGSEVFKERSVNVCFGAGPVESSVRGGLDGPSELRSSIEGLATASSASIGEWLTGSPWLQIGMLVCLVQVTAKPSLLGRLVLPLVLSLEERPSSSIGRLLLETRITLLFGALLTS